MQLSVFVRHVDTLLAKKDDLRLKSLVVSRSAQEVARLINHLEHGKRKIFNLLPPEMQADVILRMDEQSREYVLPRLSDHTVARMLHFNEEDDAADLLQIIPEERRGIILSFLKPEKKAKIEKLLTFDPETAGGLMDLNFITVPMTASYKEVSETVRHHLEQQKTAPMLVVLDAEGKAKGFIPHKSLMLAPPTATAGTMMNRLHVMPHSTDQERVLRVAARERGEVFGVADNNDRFLGVIHMRDLLRIAQSEATEDVYKFAGVSDEEEMLGSAWTAIRLRYRWLIVNLGTAFLAAFVVSLFENTISELAILAVYMPIVAGMGGNAGTQTLAVAVRGLAMGEVTGKQRWKLLGKEMLTGLVNGLINGTIVAAVIYLTRGRADIGLILAASMVINMVVAGIAGALIPLSLKALRIDPAVASAVFVTTATDVFGFLSFLGLATWFLI